MRVLEVHSTPVRSVAYSPDGSRLAAGNDGVSLYALPGGEKAGHFPSPGVEVLAWSPDGRLLAGGGQKKVTVWDSGGEQRAETQGNPDGVRGLAWSPDGLRLATAGWHPTVRFWTADLKASQDPLAAPEGAITCLVFLPTDGTLVGGGNHGALVFWERNGSRWVQSAVERTPQGIYALARSEDGALLATGHREGTIELWDARSRARVGKLAGHEWVVYGLAFSPDGTRLASGSADRTVRVWDVPGRRLLAAYPWHDTWVTSVAVSTDGMTAASGGEDGKVVVWDLADV